MFLRVCDIDNKILNGVVYSDMIKFAKSLKLNHNMVGDVYINGCNVSTGRVVFIEDNGYLTAALTGNFSLKDDVFAERITIKVRQSNSDIIIMSSSTVIAENISKGCNSMELYFRVASVFPYNSHEYSQYESKIVLLDGNDVSGKDLLSCPSEYTDIVVE